MSATMDKTQRMIDDDLPLVFVRSSLNFPAGLVLYWMTTNLWTVGPGPDHAAARCPEEARRAAEAQLAGRRRGARDGRRRAGARGRRRAEGSRARRAGAQGEAEEEGWPAAMSDDVSVEATGETVGEAKWAALRELERLLPGLDKSTVRFEVVSEGERGLLGVGYTPARVLAVAQGDAAAPPRRRAGRRRERRGGART